MTTRTWKPDPTSRRTNPRPIGWKAIRARILARDDHQCTWPGCTQQAREVDHIADPNDHSDTNLRSLCTRHHAQRTGRQAAAARIRQPRNRPQRTQHPGIRTGVGG